MITAGVSRSPMRYRGERSEVKGYWSPRTWQATNRSAQHRTAAARPLNRCQAQGVGHRVVCAMSTWKQEMSTLEGGMYRLLSGVSPTKLPKFLSSCRLICGWNWSHRMLKKSVKRGKICNYQNMIHGSFWSFCFWCHSLWRDHSKWQNIDDYYC